MTSILELSLTRHYKEAAQIWAREIDAFHHDGPPLGATIYDANGPIAPIQKALRENLVKGEYVDLFNQAVQFHDEITNATADRHIPLHYHAHHFNFDDDNRLKAPQYGVFGPREREAPAFLYNPVDPLAKDLGQMVRLAIDLDVANFRLDSVVDATGWDRDIMAKLNHVRSVENWAKRLGTETPHGQLPPNYWEVYVSQVAAPLAGINSDRAPI